jgi:hypothetical protein
MTKFKEDVRDAVDAIHLLSKRFRAPSHSLIGVEGDYPLLDGNGGCGRARTGSTRRGAA